MKEFKIALNKQEEAISRRCTICGGVLSEEEIEYGICPVCLVEDEPNG